MHKFRQAAYDVAMAKLKQEYAASPSSVNMHKECTLWTQHWLKCAKELNQWDSLLEIGLTRSGRDPFLILESSWRNPNWSTMKDALAEVEYNCPKELGKFLTCPVVDTLVKCPLLRLRRVVFAYKFQQPTAPSLGVDFSEILILVHPKTIKKMYPPNCRS